MEKGGNQALKPLTKMIFDDMKVALGVTEPAAIAFATAKARSYAKGEIKQIHVSLNSGMYKNAFTCGIPNSHKVGNAYAAALGAVAGNAEKGLEVLADVQKEDNEQAEKLIAQGKVQIALSEITSRIFIKAKVCTTEDEVTVIIQDSHTNVTKIIVNGKVELETKTEIEENKKNETNTKTEENTKTEANTKTEENTATKIETEANTEHKSANQKDFAKVQDIHQYTLQQLYEFVKTEDIRELEFIREAYRVNWELFEEGMKSPRTTFAKQLLKMNGGQIFSENEQATASLLCNAAIEARVIGLDKPAMSITGSGAHGIIATMPLYAAYKVQGYTEEQLLRATALSYLVCMYIKEYSGKLSAFCGCAIAAGTGMACGLVYLRGGTVEMMAHTIQNMAGSITGMICDGGNQGCTMKGVAAVDTAYKSVEFAMNGVYVDCVHGINGNTPEKTMQNMGRIASPGMVETEKTIIEILEEK